MDEVVRKLKEWGLYEYSERELSYRYGDIFAAILEGVKVKPKGPAPKNLPGLVNTGIELISKEKWKQVLPGSKAVACAFAGTNWKVGIVEKLKTGEVTWKELRRTKMDDEMRSCSSRSLARLMAEEINTAAGENGVAIGEITAAGVALGFAQENARVPRGIDARLTEHSSSKWWKFSDPGSDPPPSLGNLLMGDLRAINPAWRVKYFAFRNDTHGVAEDGQTFEGNILPIGFVFGTGDNGAIGPTNLELGKMPIEKDPILEKMLEMGWLPDPLLIQEYLMGGNYIRYRAAAAIGLLENCGLCDRSQEVMRAMRASKNEALMSDIAATQKIDDLRRILGIDLNDPGMAAIVQTACKTALNQAGQIMAMNVLAAAVAAGYQDGQEAIIPVEGGVFWKGFGVQETVKRTMEQIYFGNKITFKEAVGLRGVGVVALVQTVR